MTIKINREDMLELTRRMTPSRTSFTRIAGCYVDEDAYIEGTFNTNFLKLSPSEKQKNLMIAKAIPFSDTNQNLKEYIFPENAQGKDSMWRLLCGIKSCGLKNDALMETFYELISGCYQTDQEYAVFIFHDCYDIPAKASDKERLWESEEVFEYLICAICPLAGEYEPGAPECGFLFPSFRDRSGDPNRIAVFQKDSQKPHDEIRELLLSERVE
ncbi:MAG: DUF4317 family protein [Lachnospiraceae bacterium]|nr:DUF4317 family protein [Lachnospiraceae bacterium]MDD3794928.1 DUF4317 family protein [Lachnospiraceae bacterium]